MLLGNISCEKNCLEIINLDMDYDFALTDALHCTTTVHDDMKNHFCFGRSFDIHLVCRTEHCPGYTKKWDVRGWIFGVFRCTCVFVLFLYLFPFDWLNDTG